MHDLNLLNSDISDISLFETLSLRIGVSFNILDSLLSTDQRLMNMTSRTAIDFAICQELGKILLLTDLARCPRDQPRLFDRTIRRAKDPKHLILYAFASSTVLDNSPYSGFEEEFADILDLFTTVIEFGQLESSNHENEFQADNLYFLNYRAITLDLVYAMRNLGFFLIDGLNEIARFWRIRHIKPETTRSEQIELNSTTSRIIQQQNAIYPQCEKCQTTINEHWPLPMFSLKFPGPT